MGSCSSINSARAIEPNLSLLPSQRLLLQYHFHNFVYNLHQCTSSPAEKTSIIDYLVPISKSYKIGETEPDSSKVDKNTINVENVNTHNNFVNIETNIKQTYRQAVWYGNYDIKTHLTRYSTFINEFIKRQDKSKGSKGTSRDIESKELEWTRCDNWYNSADDPVIRCPCVSCVYTFTEVIQNYPVQLSTALSNYFPSVLCDLIVGYFDTRTHPYYFDSEELNSVATMRSFNASYPDVCLVVDLFGRTPGSSIYGTTRFICLPHAPYKVDRKPDPG